MRNAGQRIALVTGAGSGIGCAVAAEFAANDMAVAVNDVNAETCRAAAASIVEQGGTALAVDGDVSDRSSVAQMVAGTIERFGRLDVVVNNAGFGQYLPFADVTPADWARMLAVHLTGTFNVIQASLPHLKASASPRIINMASVAGMTGTPTHSHYSAAKAGIIGLTKALAKELAVHGITVNAVAPGLIETPFAELVSPALTEVYLQRTPCKRVGQTDEVAWVCQFLASDRSGFITGQVVSPNGGFLI